MDLLLIFSATFPYELIQGKWGRSDENPIFEARSLNVEPSQEICLLSRFPHQYPHRG